MSFLQENSSGNLASRITNKGRKKIAQGDFNIAYFQVGDSEFDYGFSMFDGITNPGQKVFTPLDKDSQVKYPYKVSESSLTGTTYGVPMQSSLTDTITNEIEAAGFVSEYIPYDGTNGSMIKCESQEISVTNINGTSLLTVNDGSEFSDTEFITIYFGTLEGSNFVIPSNEMSLTYRIVARNGNVLTLDRNMPNLQSLTTPTSITVISNDDGFTGNSICEDTPEQQDPWNLNIVWSQNPVGLDPLSITIDERLSGYTSNHYVSTKEFLGYNSSSGQTSNTGTTITNSFGDLVIVSPEEQHSLAIVHYTVSNTTLDPYASFKYEDYIDHTTEGKEYFEVYIPFLLYERNSGNTIGARFFMDSTDHYVDSSATDTRTSQMKFRYLIDEFGVRVGKIFVNHKTFVFDDQEIVAALDYKSNRRYTLPIPRISAIPVDSKCDVRTGNILEPLLSGTTGQTVFVTYVLEYHYDAGLCGIPCNYYNKIQGGTIDSDISIKFNDNDFKFMQDGWDDAGDGYIADRFKILVQRVDTGEQPDPTLWKAIDFTSQVLTGLTINPADLRGARFVVTYSDYDDAPLYVYPDPDLIDTETSPEFGDEQPFPGSVKLIRATDLEVMTFLINLPAGYFEVTQNPTYPQSAPFPSKRITEVALLDPNKDVVVIAKAASPIERIGTQVLSVKIDI